MCVPLPVFVQSPSIYPAVVCPARSSCTILLLLTSVPGTPTRMLYQPNACTRYTFRQYLLAREAHVSLWSLSDPPSPSTRPVNPSCISTALLEVSPDAPDKTLLNVSSGPLSIPAIGRLRLDELALWGRLQACMMAPPWHH